jgi:hypothetical protein
MNPDDRKFVCDYINNNCIARVPPGSKALPSYMGQGSGYYTWQFYLREALFNPRVLDIVVKDFISKYQEPIAMLVDDLTSTSHKTAIHGASVLYNHAIPIANHMYAMVFKTDKPENNKIKLIGREITVSHMFSLNDFDMELAEYEKNKELTPWA